MLPINFSAKLKQNYFKSLFFVYVNAQDKSNMYLFGFIKPGAIKMSYLKLWFACSTRFARLLYRSTNSRSTDICLYLGEVQNCMTNMPWQQSGNKWPEVLKYFTVSKHTIHCKTTGFLSSARSFHYSPKVAYNTDNLVFE